MVMRRRFQIRVVGELLLLGTLLASMALTQSRDPSLRPDYSARVTIVVQREDTGQTVPARIYLLRSVAEGRLPLSDVVAEEAFLCLDCRACETACPSGVRFGSLIELARAEVVEAGLRSGWSARLERLVLHHLIPHPRRLGSAVSLLALAQSLRLDRLAAAHRIAAYASAQTATGLYPWLDLMGSEPTTPSARRLSISEREYLVLSRTYLADGGQYKGNPEGPPVNLILLFADNSEHTHRGRVIAAAQAIDPETGTYSLEAAFDNPDGLVLPGLGRRHHARPIRLRLLRSPAPDRRVEGEAWPLVN